MVKTKMNVMHLPLVVTGYITFSLLVVATLLSTTIPFGRMLFDPRVMHFNVTVITIALTIGAILPVLVGYMIGDSSVKSKNRLSHHFNGILFGLLAYWLMTILAVVITIPDSLFTNDNARIVFANVFPSIGVAMLTTVLAIAHVRSNQAKQDILEYKLYSVVLIASIVVLPLWSLANNIVTNSVNFYSFVSLAIVAVLGFVSYASLRKTKLSNYSKLVWSAISITVVFVMVYVSNQLVFAVSNYLLPYPTMEIQSIEGWVGFALALAGWIVYWAKQVKLLR